MNIQKASVVELERRVKAIESELAKLNVQRSKLNHEKSLIAEELERRKTARDEAEVTDHALLRWMERVYGISLDDIRDEILSETARAAINMGATKVKVPQHGVALVVKDKRVVSCVPA